MESFYEEAERRILWSSLLSPAWIFTLEGAKLSHKYHIVCELIVWWCTSRFVSPWWSVYRFEAFLHDAGVHRGPDSGLLPVVASDQVWHLHTVRATDETTRYERVSSQNVKVRSIWNKRDRSITDTAVLECKTWAGGLNSGNTFTLVISTADFKTDHSYMQV